MLDVLWISCFFFVCLFNKGWIIRNYFHVCFTLILIILWMLSKGINSNIKPTAYLMDDDSRGLFCNRAEDGLKVTDQGARKSIKICKDGLMWDWQLILICSLAAAVWNKCAQFRAPWLRHILRTLQYSDPEKIGVFSRGHNKYILAVFLRWRKQIWTSLGIW